MSRKPITGFRPNVEALEDRFLLSGIPFRGGASGFFAANPTPGHSLNVAILAPFRGGLPGGTGHGVNTGPLVSHPSTLAIRNARTQVQTATPTVHPGNAGSGQANFIAPVFNSGTGITAGSSFLPGQSSGAGLNPGLTTYNLTQPAASASQNNATAPNANPTHSGTSTPWWLY